MALTITQKTAKLLGGVVLGIVALGGVYLLDYPLLAEYQEAETAVSDAQTQVDTMSSNITRLNQSKTNFETIETIDQDLKVQFPQAMLSREVLQSIFTTLAAQSGINTEDVLSIEFQPPQIHSPEGGSVNVSQLQQEQAVAGEGEDPVAAAEAAAAATANALAGTYATMQISISVVGPPQNLMRYLYNLNAWQRAIIINQIGFADSSTPSCGEDCDTLSFSGTIFIYPAIPVPDAIRVETPGTPAVDPVATPTPTPTP